MVRHVTSPEIATGHSRENHAYWFHMSLPQAHVVRKGGHYVTPPPVVPEPTWIGEQARNAFAIAIGLWPLTATLLLMVGLIIIAGNAGGP
jgi:hypothetical protein